MSERTVLCPICKQPQPITINAAVTLTGHLEDDHKITGTVMMRLVIAATP